MNIITIRHRRRVQSSAEKSTARHRRNLADESRSAGSILHDINKRVKNRDRLDSSVRAIYGKKQIKSEGGGGETGDGWPGLGSDRHSVYDLDSWNIFINEGKLKTDTLKGERKERLWKTAQKIGFKQGQRIEAGQERDDKLGRESWDMIWTRFIPSHR